MKRKVYNEPMNRLFRVFAVMAVALALVNVGVLLMPGVVMSGSQSGHCPSHCITLLQQTTIATIPPIQHGSLLVLIAVAIGVAWLSKLTFFVPGLTYAQYSRPPDNLIELYGHYLD